MAALFFSCTKLSSVSTYQNWALVPMKQDKPNYLTTIFYTLYLGSSNWTELCITGLPANTEEPGNEDGIFL